MSQPFDFDKAPKTLQDGQALTGKDGNLTPLIKQLNDGFIFLVHRIIRKRSRYGDMRVVSTIPHDKARNFAASLTALLSGNYSESKIDMVEQLNRKLKGWAAFYPFVDFKAKVLSYIARVVFWKLATGWPANIVEESPPR